MIDDSTPIPKDMVTFWPSSTNKLLLEKLLYKYLYEKIPLHHPVVIGQVVSGNEEWQPSIRDDSGLSKYLLSQPVTEEADLQIIVHVLDALKSGHYINVILSNDSDIIVHVLDALKSGHYINVILSNDSDIIVHVLDALKSGHYINVILSNDSDIIVHVLDALKSGHYINVILSNDSVIVHA